MSIDIWDDFVKLLPQLPQRLLLAGLIERASKPAGTAAPAALAGQRHQQISG